MSPIVEIELKPGAYRTVWTLWSSLFVPIFLKLAKKKAKMFFTLPLINIENHNDKVWKKDYILNAKVERKRDTSRHCGKKSILINFILFSLNRKIIFFSFK